MIACNKPLVYRRHTNRLTWASLGCYLIRRRCSRQRKLANPVIRKGQTLKKIFAYSGTSICWIRGFCHGVFLFYKNCILLYAAKTSSCHLLSFLFSFCFAPLDKILTPLKGCEQKTGLQARFSPSLSSCQLALVAPLPKQLETRTSEPARRLVYRSSGDSRYLVIH